MRNRSLDLVNLEKSIELQLSFKHSMDSWQAMYKMATDTIYIQYQKLKFTNIMHCQTV